MPSWLLSLPSSHYFLDTAECGCFMKITQILNFLLVIFKAFWDTSKISPRCSDPVLPPTITHCNLLRVPATQP